MDKLPIIKRDQIVDNLDIFSVKKERYVLRHTSGTTGKPLTIRVSYSANLLNEALVYGRRFKWAKYDGSWIARFVGDMPTMECGREPPYRVSYLTKRLFFSTYCLSPENLQQIFDILKKFDIKYIQAYPSSAYLLAKYLEYSDKYYPIHALFYSSEPMYDFQRELIKERFKTKLFGNYGHAEEIITAEECEEENYHLSMIDGVMEVVDLNYNVVSNGEKGFNVVTTLHNMAMPLIRYFLGDYTGYKNDECYCKRKLPIIYPVETKMEDFLITPGGRILSPSLLTFPLKHARNIIESQIIQKTIDSVVVKIVKGENYTNKDEMYLIKELRELLSPEMEIKVEYVNEIYHTKAYKKRFVINKLGRDYIERAFEKAEKN